MPYPDLELELEGADLAVLTTPAAFKVWRYASDGDWACVALANNQITANAIAVLLEDSSGEPHIWSRSMYVAYAKGDAVDWGQQPAARGHERPKPPKKEKAK